MANRNIHGFDIEYNDESETVKSYLNHLEESLSQDEIKAFIESAKHEPLGKTHLNDRYENKFTLVYKSDDSCLIRKREY